MDFVSTVRQRLTELGLDQRDLAAGAEVTESYISQLLRRKKLPPLPNRTDLYDKIGSVLRIPREELAQLAAVQHHAVLDRMWRTEAKPLFESMRELVLSKCRPSRQSHLRATFEKDPFGDIERLITRTLITVIREDAAPHARDEQWLQDVAAKSDRSYRTMRVKLIDLLDSDPSESIGDFSWFIDSLVRSWDFDDQRYVLTVHLTSGSTRTFSFQETAKDARAAEEPGLKSFLRDTTLSSGITADEVEFLRRIRFAKHERPTALFYYRTLQNLRDPLNFVGLTLQ